MVDSLEQERDDLARRDGEQVALRRVATLVASGVPAEELFAAVSREVGQLLSVDIAAIGRYEDDGTVTELAVWSSAGDPLPPVGSRWVLGGQNVTTFVAQTRRSARSDGADLSGPIGKAIREAGIRSAASTPIIVEGHLWGMMFVGSTLDHPLPTDTESRLASFTELVATAIANAAGRAVLAGLAEEQAALRRVATLVAHAAAPEEVFAAVTEEVGRLLRVDRASMGHYESDGTATLLTTWNSGPGPHTPIPSHWALGGENVPTLVAQTGRPARLDSYEDATGSIAAAARRSGHRASVGAPIIVEGRLWGVIVANPAPQQPLPPDTEVRLASFTELVATAIANAESRGGLARLAEEQAALRRVATLVARAVAPEELFTAVNEEVGQLLSPDIAGMGRYESGVVTSLASWSRTGVTLQDVGGRWPLGGENVPTLVAQTGRPARIDGHADASGAIGQSMREQGIRSAAGTPIIVEGHLWGMMFVGSTLKEPLALDTAARLASFTELVATAIANANSRAELAASRARIVAAADETRRRIERNLHDGAQQRLVSLGLELRAAQAAVPPELGELEGEVSRVAEGLASVQEELREMARGIHPAVLAEGGLGPALKTLARRSQVPVELDVRPRARMPYAVEVAAYYVVSEMLTNVAKHAHASVVRVEADTSDGILCLNVRDDGVGGADPARGTGLAGLKDRVEAAGGTLSLRSAVDAGTSVRVELPLDG
jgi:signal transduction histidine kinase